MVIYVRLQQQPLSTRVTLFYLGSHQANGLGGERLYASTSFFQKKNCDEFSGVHRNLQNYESESGVIAKYKIETRDKSLDWSPQEELRQRFWSSLQLPKKWKWRYRPKKWGQEINHRTDHHKKNCKTNSGLYCRSVSQNCLQIESNWDCSLYSTTFVVEQTSFFLQLLVCFLWFIFLNTKLCYKNNTGIEYWKPCFLPGCG